MHIVLVEPEIPGNTGNIARLCACTGVALDLIKLLGFSTDDKYLKRAGLDYWHLVNIHYYDDFYSIQSLYPNHSFYFFSTKATNLYTNIRYRENDFLVFGKESSGLPEHLLRSNKTQTFRIPMHIGARSLNLSNAVSIVTYEALRQQEFSSLAL